MKPSPGVAGQAGVTGFCRHEGQPSSSAASAAQPSGPGGSPGLYQLLSPHQQALVGGAREP